MSYMHKPLRDTNYSWIDNFSEANKIRMLSLKFTKTNGSFMNFLSPEHQYVYTAIIFPITIFVYINVICADTECI